MKKLLIAVMMIITVNAKAMPHYVCDPMKGLGESTIELKLKGISYQTAIDMAKNKWRQNHTAEYIQDYLSQIIRIGYETTLDADSYGAVVYDVCRTQQLPIY